MKQLFPDENGGDRLACEVARVMGFFAPAPPVPLELLERCLDTAVAPESEQLLQWLRRALGRLSVLGLEERGTAFATWGIDRAALAHARAAAVTAGEVAVAGADAGSAGGAGGRDGATRQAVREAAGGVWFAIGSLTEGKLGNSTAAVEAFERDLGDAAKAKTLLERALAIEEAAYRADHQEVAITLGNLGTACFKLGDAAEAKALLERALAIKEAAYGADHPQVAGTLTNLAIACRDLGDTAKVKTLLERALAIKEAAYGAGHLEVASMLGNLGNACVLEQLAAAGYRAGETTCPAGHALLAFATPSCFVCDVCGADQEVGAAMGGCRTCNHDICVDCLAGTRGAGQSNVTTTLDVDNAAATSVDTGGGVAEERAPPGRAGKGSCVIA
eukprot:g2609.t1